MAGRFVALGDSFTEGVGDWNHRFPNGVRGWADRVAKQLSKSDPGWEYANLAVRSLVLDDIVATQSDRLHMSRPGHRYLAAEVLRELRVDHTITLEGLGTVPERTRRQTLTDERDWWSDWVVPMLGRRLRRRPPGGGVGAKWPDPIRPADGMKRIARRRVSERDAQA